MLAILRRLVPHWWAPVLMLPFIAFYTILVGGNAAVVRAAVMCALSILGSVIGRTGTGVNNLALTSGVMCLVRPAFLSDLGFQLSVTATLGILLFSEPLCSAVRGLLSKLIPGISENALNSTVSMLNELCLMSVSAQIFTVWVSAKAFRRISLISLPANFLIAPFQSLIMLGGMASLALSYIFYPLGAAAAWLVWAAPALTIRIVRMCAEVRWGSAYFNLPPFQAWLIIGLILAIYLGRNTIREFIRRRDYSVPVILLLLFAAVMIWLNVADRLNKRTEIQFDSSRNSLSLKVRSPENRLFIIADGMSNYAAQEILEKQILPVSREPAAAWIDFSDEWMRREFLDSGSAEELDVLYLNGEAIPSGNDLPERTSGGFTFSADSVILRVLTEYLGKRAWMAENSGIRVLVPNGVPPQRIFLRNSLEIGEIDLILIGKRDDAAQWKELLSDREGSPLLLDRTESGAVMLYLTDGQITIGNR